VVEDVVVGLYGLEEEARTLNVDEHRVVGGLGAGSQLPLARPVQPPASPSAHHVRHPPYWHGALVDVVVA
jgi:hypothetical protein